MGSAGILAEGNVLSKIVTALVPFLIGLCVISIIPAILAGFYFGRKQKQESLDDYDKRSGEGSNSEVPEEIKGWDWGAAVLGVFWGPYFGVWKGFLLLIPVFNFVYFFIFGFNASEEAWRKNKWKDNDDFKKTMRVWNIIGIILFVLMILGNIGKILS